MGFFSVLVELMNCLFLFFIHLKLELLTQFPASNDEKFLTNYFIDILFGLKTCLEPYIWA